MVRAADTATACLLAACLVAAGVDARALAGDDRAVAPQPVEGAAKADAATSRVSGRGGLAPLSAGSTAQPAPDDASAGGRTGSAPQVVPPFELSALRRNATGVPPSAPRPPYARGRADPAQFLRPPAGEAALLAPFRPREFAVRQPTAYGLSGYGAGRGVGGKPGFASGVAPIRIAPATIAKSGGISGTPMIKPGSAPSGIGGPAKPIAGINGTTLRSHR